MSLHPSTFISSVHKYAFRSIHCMSTFNLFSPPQIRYNWFSLSRIIGRGFRCTGISGFCFWSKQILNKSLKNFERKIMKLGMKTHKALVVHFEQKLQTKASKQII